MAMVEVLRIGDKPIVHNGLSPTLDGNINGPSLVARPEWAPGPGRYMLYFAHHQGSHIRLAFADRLTGPWTVHEPGLLHLPFTAFATMRPNVAQPDWTIGTDQDGLVPHIASPDVHLSHFRQRFEMLCHGLCNDGEQRTCRAYSYDGLRWNTIEPTTDQTYLRRFTVEGHYYAVALNGEVMKSDGSGRYLPGHQPFAGRVRHVAVLQRPEGLHVFYTRIGDVPEHLLHALLDISGDWTGWSVKETAQVVLKPELEWEGANLPVEPSQPGLVGFSNALRDPAVFEEDGRVYLVYAGGGEAALGLAEIRGL